MTSTKESLEFIRNLKVAFRLVGIECSSNGDALVIANLVDCVREKNGNPTIADLADSIEQARISASKLEEEFYKTKEETK